MDNTAAGPSEAPPKKKRQRVRKSTRDRRRKEMAEWEAANLGSIGETQAEEEAAGGNVAVEEDKGEVEETKKSKGKGKAAVAQDGGASQAESLSIPASELDTPKIMLLSEHDEIVKQVRAEAQRELDVYYEETVQAQAAFKAATESLVEKDNEIKQLKQSILDFEQDIEDPERGYDAQIKAAQEAVKDLQAEVDRQKSRANAAESSRTLVEEIKEATVNKYHRLQEQLKSKDAEIIALQRRHQELDETIGSLNEDTGELDELKAQIAQYEEYDSKLSLQLDSWIQGMVHTEDAFEKVEALGKSLQEAREAAETARNVAQEEVEKLKSKQQVLTFSEITSISQRPIEPTVPEYASAATQTSIEASSVVYASTATQTSVDVSAVTYSSSATQTLIEVTPVYHQAGSQTIPEATYRQASSQTELAKMRNASSQTKRPITNLPAASTAGSNNKDPRDDVRRNRSAQTVAIAAETRSSGTQTPPLKATPVNTETLPPPPVKYWSAYSQLSDMLMWLLLFLLIFFALPSGFSMLSSSKSASSFGFNQYGRLPSDEFDAKFFTEDLAKVGFERWLGVDTSWLT